MLGPFKTISRIFREQHWAPFKAIISVAELPDWAQSRLSAMLLSYHTGPIQDHRQHISEAMLGPFKIIGSIS
jgi:hypothetical protein